MPDTEQKPPRKGLPWWGLMLIGLGGTIVPQLCSLIPNAVGSTVCRIAAQGVAQYFTTQDNTAVALPPPPAPVPDCPPERRLSTGQCLPP